MIYLNREQIENIRPIILTTFPDYKGLQVKVIVTDSKISLNSHWEGGSRDYFLVNLNNLQAKQAPQSGTMFDKIAVPEVAPEFNLAIVKHSIIQGKDAGITIYVHPDNAKHMSLEQSNPFTDNERIVLYFTRSTKNSYGGETDCRFKEALRTTALKDRKQWEEAQESLRAGGYLNKAFALTPEGKTAASNLGLNLPSDLRTGY